MPPALFRIAVIVLAIFVAVAPPIQYLVALHDPAVARYLGLELLRALPRSTFIVVVAACICQSLLAAYVVVQLARLVACFHRGEFFTACVVSYLRRAGLMLLAIAALSIATLIAGVVTANVSSNLVTQLPWWTYLLGLPADTLLCGLVVLAIAGAFERARRMADDQRYTV